MNTMTLHGRPILRWLFALIYLVTSVGKLLDNRGFAQVLSTYRFPLPEAALLPLGLAFSLFELALALALLRAPRRRELPSVVVFVQATYLAVAVVSYLRGLAIPNCGCFGVFWGRPLTAWTLVEDLLLLALAASWLALERAAAAAEPTLHGEVRRSA